MKSTEELYNEIQTSNNILDYLENNSSEMLVDNLAKYLEDWLLKKKLKKADVIRDSNLNRAYVYQIFLGKKYPSKDKIIALAFGLKMNETETQTLLKQAGYRELYPRDTRDALLIYAFKNKMNIIDTNELLYDHDVEVLE